MTVCIKKPARIIAISLCKYKTILLGAKSCLAFLARVNNAMRKLNCTSAVNMWSAALEQRSTSSERPTPYGVV